MADCNGCGKRLGFLEGNNGFCEPCFISSLSPNNRARDSEKAVERKLASEKELETIKSVMLTTEAYPQGLVILERIEIVTAECAFGMNMFKDLFAGVRDIVGGRSEAVQKTMRDSRRTALYELKREAHAVGANAVVGVDLDYVELSGVGSMVLLVASGTAVRIEQ